MEKFIVGTIFGRIELYKSIDGVYYAPEKKKNVFSWYRTVLCQDRVKTKFVEISKDEADKYLSDGKVAFC